MERVRREALRRLGAPTLCADCGKRTEGRADTGEPLCSRCYSKRSYSALAHRVVNEEHRHLALRDTARVSDQDYLAACEAMADDVDEALADWPMGNGILGPRY